MNLIFEPARLSGKVLVPPSKSLTHRAILAAALCNGVSTIKNFSESEDVSATLEATRKLGARACYDNGSLKIFGGIKKKVGEELVINCSNSASTFRFLVAVLAAFEIDAVLTGSTRLIERIGSGDELNLIEKVGCGFKISRKLKPGRFKVGSKITSQFVSGLLLALPVLEKPSVVEFEENFVSRPYVALTVGVLKKFGIKIESLRNGYFVYGNQKYSACEYEVEGDFSQAAFFIILGCLAPVLVYGLKKSSDQGDRTIVDVVENCGAKVCWKKNSLLVAPFENCLNSFEINAENIPDLVPALAILACFCSKTSRIFGISRLKFKESDRKISIFEMIKNIGGDIEFADDYFKIDGVKKFSGGIVESFKDHRIAMASAVAAGFSTKPIEVLDALCVKKSYANFYFDYLKLGGSVSGIFVE